MGDWIELFYLIVEVIIRRKIKIVKYFNLLNYL